MRMLLAGLMILLATAADAHHAPSGFTYDPSAATVTMRTAIAK